MYDYISACRCVCVCVRARCVHAAPMEANRGRRLLPPLPQVELKAVVSCREGGGPGQKRQMFSFAEPFLQPQI